MGSMAIIVHCFFPFFRPCFSDGTSESREGSTTPANPLHQDLLSNLISILNHGKKGYPVPDRTSHLREGGGGVVSSRHTNKLTTGVGIDRQNSRVRLLRP
ncbi:hypothetical protein BDV38DRAFT_264172 [Aspergillus pseudotamarii]|uniref:Secreted protein n=1 Tax=Aspergillus pseudotamarii TaxID=132259 RepID=A0A5N6SCG6_ASPPS|nr:uncharacterized protein BDV38DRAFT_264172 [Aspergillus pseudotamarii]KAE8131549.1 hypothetical protein BDV38DRAFT_264172 [Aspergillus pseudotamarii]